MAVTISISFFSIPLLKQEAVPQLLIAPPFWILAPRIRDQRSRRSSWQLSRAARRGGWKFLSRTCMLAQHPTIWAARLGTSPLSRGGLIATTR